MTYARTKAQKATDWANCKEFENRVAEGAPVDIITHFNATDKLDIWVPGYFVEIKEKRQRYTDRWWLLPGVPETDLFIQDELTVRRALQFWPWVFFVVHDCPNDRFFYQPIWETVSAPRAQVNRNGKGKWVMSFRHMHPMTDPCDIYRIAPALLADCPWKGSSTAVPAPEVRA